MIDILGSHLLGGTSDAAIKAICPGTVRTNLLTETQWDNFPPEYFTPLGKIVEVVLMLVNGDAKQGGSTDAPLYGQAVEVNCDKYYFRTQHEYCDEKMAALMGATDARWKHEEKAAKATS